MNSKWREERIGGQRLILGDCLEVMEELGRFDAVVTDPPYGVNLGNHLGASDTRKTVLRKGGYSTYEDTFDNFVNAVVPAIEMALVISERAAVWMSDVGAWRLPAPSAVGGAFLPSAMGRSRWGFASLQHCLFYGAAPDLHKGAKATAFRSTETSEPSKHPCPKPIGWMKWTLNIASRPGETILDPFMGSGTTLVACQRMGRSGTGIEIDPEYFDIACRRVDEASRQPDMFVAPPVREVEQVGFAFDDAGSNGGVGE